MEKRGVPLALQLTTSVQLVSSLLLYSIFKISALDDDVNPSIRIGTK
jgi:hypothetical protein